MGEAYWQSLDPIMWPNGGGRSHFMNGDSDSNHVVEDLELEFDCKTLLSPPPVEMFHECYMEHVTVKKYLPVDQSINQSISQSDLL